jgi:hypothetical protein
MCKVVPGPKFLLFDVGQTVVFSHMYNNKLVQCLV